MLWVPLAFVALVAVNSPGGETVAEDVPPRLWEISGAVVSAKPLVLPGLALGVSLAVQRRVAARPVFVATHVAWTTADAANDSWAIVHQQFVLAVGGGAAATRGAGRVWVEAGGGLSGLREVLSRHQLQRIQTAGVPGGEQFSLTVGPYGFAEIGVSVRMRWSLLGFLAGGAAVASTSLGGHSVWRWGGSGRVGLAYEF